MPGDNNKSLVERIKARQRAGIEGATHYGEHITTQEITSIPQPPVLTSQHPSSGPVSPASTSQAVQAGALPQAVEDLSTDDNKPASPRLPRAWS